jgi:hypothetical protein
VKNITRTLRTLCTLSTLSVLSAVQASAQSIASRVNNVREGDVRMSFDLRPGVCGDGRNVWYDSNSNRNYSRFDERTRRDVEYDIDCSSGPGRLVVVRRDGETVELRFYVGGRWRSSSSVTDLGTVSPRAAVDFLLTLAETHDGKAGREAIFPATLADSVTIWPSLLRIARNDSRPRSTREQATFWLGHLAEEPATRGLTELVGDAAVDREVRESAIFALSQRRGEGVPALINVVRTSRDPELRKKALFWLANSRDPRALDLIEELLTKR